MRHLTVRDVRFMANQPARLVVNGKSVNVVIRDISEGFHGVGLEAANPIALFPGNIVELHLVHEGTAVVVKGVVRWSTGGAHLGLDVRSIVHEDLTPLTPSPVQPTLSQGRFLIELDSVAGEIVCRHVTPDGKADHTVRHCLAAAILTEVLTLERITDLSRAASLVGELTKAETCLRLGLPYVQGEPVRV